MCWLGGWDRGRLFYIVMVGGAGDGAGMPEMMLSPELVQLRDALAKIRAGRRCEINAIRMLEFSELFRDAQQTYWAAMATAIATQAVRPDVGS